MSSQLILEGKSLEKIIAKGLKQLNKTRDEVDIEVIDDGKKIMGLSFKKKRVKFTIKEKEIEDNSNFNNIINDAEEEIKRLDREHMKFKLLYLEDGVYLNIPAGNNLNNIRDKILTKLERKQIKDYDLNAIKNIPTKLDSEITKKIAPPQEEELIDSSIDVFVTADKMKGYLVYNPPEGGGKISFDDAMEKIKDKIKLGLMKNKVREVIDNDIYNKEILIAQGKEAINGEDGRIKFNFDIKNEAKIKVLEDGSVDFRDLDLINNVKKEDVLAEIIEPKEGTSGYLISGEELKAKDGKAANIGCGKNTVLNDEGDKIISQCNGQVSLEGNKIVVNQVYEISGNVDNSTGNIDFKGTVKIKGNVRTGFMVKADKDIEVNGVVEGAYISSGNDILLKRGMQGHNKGELYANNNIVAKYIENSKLKAKNDIKAEAIMHSDIISGGSIEVTGKKGLIVGGSCKAKSEIRANIIGSSMATNTVLEVGVSPGLKEEFENTKKEIENLQENITKLQKSIKLLNKMERLNQLSPEKQVMLKKSIETKETLEKKLNLLQIELEELETDIEALSDGKVHVDDVVHSGVKIIIGNSVMFVKRDYNHCTIYKEKGEIIVGGYQL